MRLAEPPGLSSFNDLDRAAFGIARLHESPLAPQQLVVIDARVDDVALLLRGFFPESHVLVVDSQCSGLEQIGEAIAHLNAYVGPIHVLYIVCHGEPGRLHLGHTPITAVELEKSRSLVKNWNVKEIQLYACHVAAELYSAVSTPSLMQRFVELTGAAIAASAHKVGSLIEGGTWYLEHRIGCVNSASPLPLRDDVRRAYVSTF